MNLKVFSEIKWAFDEVFKASDTFSLTCRSLGVLSNVRSIKHLYNKGNQQNERVGQNGFCSICVDTNGARVH